ncbi:MAG: hypothetical protein REI95_05975, partial [Oxalicibacterium faecigallinarum]|uniref:hypothetical protein n=1 Tax=Oxalicibacterium faecigallinarum TaxID=573741 RepID=UPI002808973B
MNIASDVATAAPSFSLTEKTIALVGANTMNGKHAMQAISKRGASIIVLDDGSVLDTLEPASCDGLLCCAEPVLLPIATMQEKEIQHLAMQRLVAPLAIASRFLRDQILRKSAAIVFEKHSIAHLRTEEGGYYLSMESGIDALAGTLALEYAPMKIRVNTVTTRASGSSKDADAFANASIYLLAPASRWVTGSN